jgi:hypothetical protein
MKRMQVRCGAADDRIIPGCVDDTALKRQNVRVRGRAETDILKTDPSAARCPQTASGCRRRQLHVLDGNDGTVIGLKAILARATDDDIRRRRSVALNGHHAAAGERPSDHDACGVGAVGNLDRYVISVQVEARDDIDRCLKGEESARRRIGKPVMAVAAIGAHIISAVRCQHLARALRWKRHLAGRARDPQRLDPA